VRLTVDGGASKRERANRVVTSAPPIRVPPGAHHVSADPNALIVTVLGSCVAACIRDRIGGIGGMNHFMLPQSDSGNWGKATASLRYGNFAMERLINDLLMRGAKRENLEIKVFGGANVLNLDANIGWKNADFVEAYLATEGFAIAAQHLRGTYPRRVHYFPGTGKAQVLELRRREDLVVVEAERTYGRNLTSEPIDGSVELFD